MAGKLDAPDNISPEKVKDTANLLDVYQDTKEVRESKKPGRKTHIFIIISPSSC